MNRFFFLPFSFLFTLACARNEVQSPVLEKDTLSFIYAVDISNYPQISESNMPFFDQEGREEALLAILKTSGVNTIRLRLWVNPTGGYSGFEEVNHLSVELKSKGFKTWLSVHYSDTWADPGSQKIPKKWKNLNFDSLKDSVFNYTRNIVTELNPDYIQIGNEINNGLLHPHGNMSTNYEQFLALMKSSILAVRDNINTPKIIIHYEGIKGSDWFFRQLISLDYDIIGLSYYPIWHGKSLTDLKDKMQLLAQSHHKKIVIAETAYPFTLEWNDDTNNIVGMAKQLINPDYPATPMGQLHYMETIKSISTTASYGIGYCYWGAELIAWKGSQATDGSPWENQALFDFNHRALPALDTFANQ